MTLPTAISLQVRTQICANGKTSTRQHSNGWHQLEWTATGSEDLSRIKEMTTKVSECMVTLEQVWYHLFIFVRVLRFNDLLGPFIFTIVNVKKRPAITFSVLYDLGSCPFTLVIAIP